MNEIILRLLTEAVGTSNIAVNELMSKHTTFKIGGAADILVSPESLGQLKTVMRIIKQFKVPYTIIGNGSNILVSDIIDYINNHRSEYEEFLKEEYKGKEVLEK